jgi:putative ABC transport system permease protein
MRSLAALAGISFSILLIFMQLGIRSAIGKSATLIYKALDFDLLVVSPHYRFLARAREFPRDSLARVLALPGVERVTAFQIGWPEWRNPLTGKGWPIMVLGVDPGDEPFRNPAINALLPRLTVADRVLIDTRTRPEYGPQDVGTSVEMSRHRVRIVGQYTIGAGFVANGSTIMSDETFERLFGAERSRWITLGLVKLHPGAESEDAARRANTELMPMARVVTRATIEAGERQYSLAVKPIGILFTSGVLVAFAVGCVILYQVLASEIQNRLGEYATLKALGYSTPAVYGVVLQQGLILATLGYVPAFLGANALYALMRTQALLPATMVWARVFGVLGLTYAMCLLACLLAIQKLKGADPADLF